MFIVHFEHQPKYAKKGPKQTKTFHILQTQVHKKIPFVATPLLTKNLCFLKRKTLMLNKKHNLKLGKIKDKKEI